MFKLVLVSVFLTLGLASRSSHAGGFCLAPFAIADRWDDATAIPGYAGGSHKSPDWRNDGRWEREAFTDLNSDGLYDVGEAYIDANANGSYDSELYGQLITGFVLSPTPENVISPGGDLGLQITLLPATSPDDENLGHYLSLQTDCAVFLSAERPNGGDIRAIDAFLRGQIAADSSAIWDPVTKQVVGSKWCISPRLIPLPIYDPRAPLRDVHGMIRATKIVTVFLEAVVGKGSATIRIASFPDVGSTLCTTTTATASGPLPTLPAKATWGRLKASYR